MLYTRSNLTSVSKDFPMIVLREYQEIAVDDLTDKLAAFVEMAANKKLVFKAPTGSGKTIIIAEALKKLVTEKNPGALAFIWAAPRKLHSQSKEKLENFYFESKALRCSFFEDLLDKAIGENEILFLNWRALTKRIMFIYGKTKTSLTYLTY